MSSESSTKTPREAAAAEHAALADEALRQARERWPELSCPAEVLAEHLAEVGARPEDVATRGAELCLACACARADSVAIRIFDADYVGKLGPTLRRLGDAAFADEARQVVRERMLLAPEPRIATYAGTGPLLGWLRITGLRLALNLRRSAKPPTDALLVESFVSALPVESSELPRYLAAFEAALGRALSTLGLDDRNLLRLHHIDGVTLDRLAVLFRVHRATIARRLAVLRRKIFADVEAEVKQTLSLSPSEFHSMLDLVRSYLDASLSGLFGPLAAG